MSEYITEPSLERTFEQQPPNISETVLKEPNKGSIVWSEGGEEFVGVAQYVIFAMCIQVDVVRGGLITL